MRGLCLLLLVGVALAASGAGSGGAAPSAAVSSAASAAASGGSAAPAASANSTSSSGAAAVPTIPPAPCDGYSAPDSYSRNLGYVILVGSSGFLFVAIVFFGLTWIEQGNKVVHVLAFFACIILTFGYFSLWEGIGTQFKNSLDGSCRLIFPGRLYALWLSVPIVATAFILFCRVEHGAIIGGVGAVVIALFAWTLGSTLQGPEKYVWWVVGSVFVVAEIVHLFAVSSASKRALTANGAAVANIVFIVISASLFGYAVIWVIGGTGTGYLAPATELAWYFVLDAFLHVGVGFALVTSGEAVLEGSFVPLLQEGNNNYHQAYGSGNSASYAPPGFPSRESRQYV